MTVTLPWPPRELSPNARWTSERDSELRRLHGTMPIAQIAVEMGTTRGSIRARVTRLGLRKRDDSYTDEEMSQIRAHYESAEFGDDINLSDLVQSLGRPKSSISRMAASMGLSDIGRPKRREKVPPKKPKHATEEARRKAVSEATKARFRQGLHPRGMLGKRHSPETRAALSQSSSSHWKSMTAAQREDQVNFALKAKLDRHGTLAPNVKRGSWKAGWREIGGKRNYYRSRWEANYARYLEWLKGRGEIVDWQHEPQTFWFEAIRRGVRSYLPDFRVWEKDGSTPLHEVKGWMDARSKTTLKRMAKYHPKEKIVVIRERDYNAIARSVSMLIPCWEHSERKGRR